MRVYVAPKPILKFADAPWVFLATFFEHRDDVRTGQCSTV